MDYADLVRLYGESVLDRAACPKRIRVTEASIRGSAVDVPCPEGGRELRVHPDDWQLLLENLRTVPAEDWAAVHGLPVKFDTDRRITPP